MVVSEDESPRVTPPPTSAAALATIAVEYPGHAVIDTGATDTLASLEALEQVVALRAKKFGPEDIQVREQRKKFRFGNGESQRATSFVEIPQILDGQQISLGLHAIDAPGVPVLLSVRTLRKLGAVIDMATNTMHLKNVSDRPIQLKRSSNEHLLLDLTSDWYQQDAGHSLKGSLMTASEYMEPSKSSQSMFFQEPSFVGPQDSESQDEELLTEEQYAVQHVHQSHSFVPPAVQPECLEHDDPSGSSPSMRVGATAVAIALATSVLSPPATTSHAEDSGLPAQGCRGETDGGAVNTLYYDLDLDFGDQGESKGQIFQGQDPSAQLREVRLREDDRTRSPRSSHSGLPLLGKSSEDAGRKRQSERAQWTRSLERVPEVPVEAGVHPHVRRQRHLPTGRSTPQGRRDGGSAGWHGCGRPPSGSRDAEHQGCGPDRSRRVHAPTTAAAGEREECFEAEASPRRKSSHQSSDLPVSQRREQEGREAREREGSGISGIERGLVPGVFTSDVVNGTDFNLTEPYETILDTEEYKDFEPVTNILTDEQKSRLQYQATEFLAEAYSAMEQFPEENFEISLMELCCPPDSRLTQTFLDHGKQAIRIGLPAIDFSHKKGLHEVLQMIDRWKPKVLWISLPCGPYSPIQELFNESTPESLAKSLERKKRAKKLIHHGIEAAEHQITRGGEVAWEWPVNNRGWTLPRVRAFFEKLAASGSDFGARVDGCAHGLKGPKGLPVKKPWRIRTTSSTLAGALHRLCPGHEQHEECLGGKTARDSGFYPQSMCNVIYKSVVEMMACGKNFNVFPSAYPIFDTKDLEDLEEKKKSVRLLSEDEKKQAGKLVDRLRKKTGHPSNAALAGVLRHRGAHPEIIQMASQHHCSECQELRAAPLHAAATLEKSDTLWEVLVVDNMQFTADGATHHYMVMMDEASRLVCAHHLFSHDPEESRNATAQEVMDGLGTWFLHYGMPAKVRMDAEGAFRSTLLGQWCSERGLELLFCAAEDHGQIGLVERAISTLKSTIRQILQGGDHSVKEAVIAACCTHNSMERIGGYSPCQWAFGRQPTLTGRMHDRGHDDPWWTSSAVPGSSVMQNLRLRVKAQQSFLQAQAHELISRASNSKTRKEQIFLPGDLVYFKRIKPPAQSQALMRMPFKLWRWYGPARVLASETRTDSFGTQRKPSNIVWIVSQGRLKRCSPSQLRHASAREKVIAEGMSAPTAVWTFHSLARDILKGEYGILDDQMFPEDVTAKGPQRATRRSQSLGRAPMTPVPATPTTTRRSSSVPRTPVLRTPEDVRGTREDVPNKTSNKIRSEMSGGEEAHRGASSSEAPKEREKKVPKLESVARDVDRSDLQSPRVDISRLLRDPGYEPDAMASRGAGRPLSELFEQPLFEKQRKHLAADTDDVLLATSFFTSNGSVQIGNLACCIELPVPHTSSELRRMKRSPENFFIKKVKGAEVKWHLLDEQEKAKFKIAKEAEVSQWLQAAAVKAAIGPVPRNRLIRMRWVLTYKDTGAAKGRIVLIGYEDPDLQSIQSAAPTMTRRTRQLCLQLASIRGWRTLKGDVKSAFLQGDAVEEKRDLFAIPVDELADALGVPRGHAVQVVKSCYGLVNAPASWFQKVRDTLLRLGFVQSKTDPCLWLFFQEEEDGSRNTLGFVCSHVDDFLVAGDEQSSAWTDAVTSFYQSFRWSPWECNAYTHCGIQLKEEHDFSTTLDHSKFIESIEQIQFRARPDHEAVTPDELTQLRGILGALQWRTHQTTPLQAARLGQLQSEISHATVGTLKAANKLAREAFHQRHVSTRINQLGLNDPKEVCFIGWSDAALANRRDLGSTGGYIIAVTSPSMLDGKRSPLTFVSWRSARLQRKARSSLAAEAQALAECDQELMFCRLAWAELCGFCVNLKVSHEAVSQVPGCVVIDAKALYDVLMKKDLNSSGLGLRDKFSALEILCLLESIDLNKTTVRWVHSEAQLADALTKPLPAGALFKAIVEGHWTLSYDPDFTSAKRLKSLRSARGISSGQPFWGMSESEAEHLESVNHVFGLH